MVDIYSATAEIRRGKNERKKVERRKKPDTNIMSASATQGGHNKKYVPWNVYLPNAVSIPYHMPKQQVAMYGITLLTI